MTGISTRITMKPRVEEIASGRGTVQGGSIYPDKRLHEFQVRKANGLSVLEG
jgi:hypothetical protein